MNITAKSNIPGNLFWDGKLLFILPNSNEISANYEDDGTWWALYTFDDYGEYEVKASYALLDDVIINNATVTINKVDSTLTVGDIAFDYGCSGSGSLSFDGAVGVDASVVGQPDAIVNVNEDSITIAGLNAGNYTLTVTTIADDDHNSITKNAKITVNKAKTELAANAVTATYNINKNLVITLKDSNGNLLSGAKVTVDLNGAKTYTTDNKGQVKVAIGSLVPKEYAASINFAGNDNYLASSAVARVTVKKASPKMTAKAKSFKFEDKTKIYKITLKDNNGKAMKNKKVTLKVNGKTYTAKTNSKGVATFKIKKLSKKGEYTAVIKYAGDKYYLKASKKAKMTVKAPAWKTVSKGHKNKATVKKIQKSLKKNGYYLSYKGRYLKVDGIYDVCTVRSVKEFQRDKNLKATGKVDYNTAKKLGII